MIRIIIDNLLYMGIAAAIICILMLVIGSISREKLSARLLWAGWLVAVLTLLIPLYALFGTLQLTVSLPGQSQKNAQYHAVYSDTMDQNVGVLLAPAKTKNPSAPNPSLQEKNNSSSSITSQAGTATPSDGAIIPAATAAAGNISEVIPSGTSGTSGAQAASDKSSSKSNSGFSADLLSVRDILFGIWIAGILIIGSIKSYRYFRFKQMLLNTSTLCDGKWDDFLPGGIHTGVTLREGEIPSPIVFGVFHPTIVIPSHAKNRESVRYALMHEFLHIERKDLFTKTVAEAAAVIHWFNPFAWIIRSKITKYCENSCDESVAAQLSAEGRKGYAMAILDFMNVSALPEPNCPSTLMSFAGEAEHVKTRLRKIMKYKKKNLFVRIITVCIILLAAASGTLTACALSNSGSGTSPVSSNSENASDSSIGSAQNTSASSGTAPTESLSNIKFDLNSDPSAYRKNLYIDANEEYVMVLGGAVSPLRMDGKLRGLSYSIDFYPSYDIAPPGVQFDMDGSSLAVILYTEDTSTGNLMYCDGKKVFEVARDVDRFQMSSDGSKIAYLTGAYEHGVGDTLYLYDCETGSSQLISQGAGRLFTLSPGGDALSFTTFYKADDPDAITSYYLINGGVPREIGNDCVCIALTDDASIVYYVKKSTDGEKFYALCGKSSVLLSPSDVTVTDPNWTPQYCFNNDCTQVVFGARDKVYLSVGGKEAQAVLGGTNPAFIGTLSLSYDQQGFFRLISDDARISNAAVNTGTKNLCNVLFHVLTGEDSFIGYPVYFDENLVEHKVAAPSSSWNVHLNGQILTYSDSGGFWLAKNYLDAGALLVNTDLLDYKYSADGTSYSLSNGENSTSESGTSDTVLTITRKDTENVLIPGSPRSMALFEKEGPDILYYLVPAAASDPQNSQTGLYAGAVYCSLYSIEDRKGAEPVLIAENVCYVTAGDFGVAYKQFASKEESFDNIFHDQVNVYYSRDGENFEQVIRQPMTYQIGG